MKAEDGIWLNLKTENPSVALKRPDLFVFFLSNPINEKKDIYLSPLYEMSDKFFN